MQILIKGIDEIKKEISPTSSLYDRGWNDALEKAKECFTSYNPVIEWIPTELMLPPEPDEDVDIEELPQYTVTIKGAEWPTSLRYIGNGEWADVGVGREIKYTVSAWMPMPEVYKEK